MTPDQVGEQRLACRGWQLPEPFEPPAAFVLGVEKGGLLTLSGMMAFGPDGPRFIGKVGRELDLGQAREAAIGAVLQALSAVIVITGSLNAVTQVVRMTVYVNAVQDFTEHYAVADAASEVLHVALGPRGRHSRTSLGVSGLSYQTPVEVDLVFAIEK